MHDTAMVPRDSAGHPPGWRPLADEQLADGLLGKAQAGGAGRPAGRVGVASAHGGAGAALAEEMTGHLGYENTIGPGGAAGTAVTAPAARLGIWVVLAPPPVPGLTPPTWRLTGTPGPARLLVSRKGEPRK